MKIESDDWDCYEGRNAEIIAWAKANNLVPEDVVAVPGEGIPALVIEDGQIHWHEFVRNEKGHSQIDPAGEYKVLSVARVSPLLTPYPERKMGE